jgi:hypothetical protein
MAPAANAEAGGLSSRKAGKIAAGDDVPYRKRRIRNVRVHLPLGPTSIYYDYPYYYSRGYYPTHIGGYVYYPPRFYRRYHRN